MQINGKGVIVTGGGSGLGEATARLMAARGAKVAIVDFDTARGQAVADDIGAVFCQADVSDERSVEAAVTAANDTLGGPARIVVNCAGIAPAAKVVGRDGTLSVDAFDRALRVNLLGSYIVMSYATRAMLTVAPEDGERGVVINTASIAYQDGQMGQTAYAASKGGIAGLTLPAARDFARDAIRVMAIAPGLFNTPMMQGLPDEVTDKIVSNIVGPARLGDPAEFALLATQIVENPYLNGTVIRLDAATRLPPR